MIKVKEEKGEILVDSSMYYTIIDNSVFINKRILYKIFSKMDVSTSNMDVRFVNKYIDEYLKNKFCNLPVVKINNEIHYLLLKGTKLNKYNFKQLFINLNYIIDSIREYINLSISIHKSNNLALTYESYKSVNKYMITHNNINESNRVLDYKMVLDSTKIRITHNKDNSTIKLEDILLTQINNILVKNLKFTRNGNIYELELLTFKNAKEVFNLVIKRLSILESKLIIYNKIYKPVERVIDELKGDDIIHGTKKYLKIFYLNLILYKRDFRVYDEFLTIEDKLDLGRHDIVTVNRLLFDKVIVMSGVEFPILKLLKNKDEYKINQEIWIQFKKIEPEKRCDNMLFAYMMNKKENGFL